MAQQTEQPSTRAVHQCRTLVTEWRSSGLTATMCNWVEDSTSLLNVCAKMEDWINRYSVLLEEWEALLANA